MLYRYLALTASHTKEAFHFIAFEDHKITAGRLIDVKRIWRRFIIFPF